MTQMEYIRRHFDKFVTPEYQQRYNVLKSYQRVAYTNMLMEVLHRDVVQALLDYVKMSLVIDYSANHGNMTGGLELFFDWNFPPDPWKKEWWKQDH